MRQVIENPNECTIPPPVLRSPVGTTSENSTAVDRGLPQPAASHGSDSPQTTSPPNPFLIAWNELPPDGSRRNAELILIQLEKHLDARVLVSVGSSLDRLMILATQGTQFQENTPCGQAIKNALREACLPEGNCRFAVANGQTSLLLKQVLENQKASLIISFSLHAKRSTGKGPEYASILIMIENRSDVKSAADYAQSVEAIRNALHSWFEVWWLCHCGMNWQKTVGSFHRILIDRRKLLLGAVAFLLAGLWIPVPYWPKRDCILEPANKSFIASPIDGILKDVSVRPGDEVAKGMLLARLDDEPVRWELSSAYADMETAGKRRDSALTSRNSGDLRLAQLEQEKQRVTIAALEKQLENLELRSPVDGVIVQGSLDEHSGMPVSRGATLFEIAPLDRMRLEIHLTTSDLANVEVGQRVTLRVDADRWNQWTATIIRIAPRAKVIDSQVVFIATAEIDNPDRTLRPGMDGKVRISAGTKSIGWLVFSKPYEWLLSKFYW